MNDFPIIDLPTDLPVLQAMESEEPVSEKARSLGTISRLLGYPDDHYVQLVELLYLIVQGELPEAAKEISLFGQYVEQCNEYELEEGYTRTFDVNPSCALEIGWHLFGEDYTRGQFLVRMRGELTKYEITETLELPDHMTHVLYVLASMTDQEAEVFSHACVFPALHKMQTSLDKTQSPYRHLIKCLVQLLEHYYGASEPWGVNEDKMLANSVNFPGQNGPRPPGKADPLRSYPMPNQPMPASDGSAEDGSAELVTLQMKYQPPEM